MRFSALSCSIAVLALLSLPLFAGSKDPRVAADERVAKLQYQPKALAWDPQIAYRSVTLRVVGPGGYLHDNDFGTGKPVFDLSDQPGLADGQYKFELIFGRDPDATLAKAMANADFGEDGTISDSALKAKMRALTETVSGSFRVEGGRIVSPHLFEPNAAAVQKTLIPYADGTIRSSLCVGFDCLDSESFGFDTIRLKENNTRIKFEDTSVAPFATNDWQLTANDSASGGLEKFSIEDVTGAKVPFTVEGGAATNSLYIDSTGRVGLRTATPVLDLHINTGNTPGLRVEQNSSGGFTAQTWDIAGNEANFFIRDVTSGSRLPFRIRPGAPTSSIDISASGNVGVGTGSPISNGGGREMTVASTTPNTFAALNLQGTRDADGALGVLRFYNGTGLVAGQVAGVRDGADDSASMRFLTANAGTLSEKMRITPTGNVGVGTMLPISNGGGREMTVASTTLNTYSALNLQGTRNSDGALGVLRFYNGAGLVAGQVAGVRDGADNSASMRFLTANAGTLSEKMRITPVGNVGIGTQSPTDTLHVVGSVRVTGDLHVSGSIGPDYVFDPKFKLASIDENAAYMWRNRHLPAVGPARTGEDGKGVINVAAHVNGMLEELEKAHIYIERLHLEIKELKAEAAQRDALIRAEIAALRRQLGN